MNDFTKEELIQIYNFIERNKQDSYDDMRFKIIEEKLQSMIDSYCEHEKCNHEFRSQRDELPLAKTICCGEELEYTNTVWSIPKCHKCGSILNEK